MKKLFYTILLILAATLTAFAVMETTRVALSLLQKIGASLPLGIIN